jgi:hypothetical protein
VNEKVLIIVSYLRVPSGCSAICVALPSRVLSLLLCFCFHFPANCYCDVVCDQMIQAIQRLDLHSSHRNERMILLYRSVLLVDALRVEPTIHCFTPTYFA